MLLAVNISNKIIYIGIFENDKLILKGTILTTYGTKYEIALKLKSFLNILNINENLIKNSIIASVVPALTTIFSDGIEFITGIKSMIVGPGIKTGINIVIDNPSELGADLVCASVYALEKFEKKVMLINMSTATSFVLIDEIGKLIGVTIIPGVESSLKSLYKNSALLPQTTVKKTNIIYGTNTIKSMESGIFFGTLAMIEGLITKIEEDLGYSFNILLTGDNAEVFVDSFKRDMHFDKDLILKGLNLLYNKNIKK